jgi:hypothetical protein
MILRRQDTTQYLVSSFADVIADIYTKAAKFPDEVRFISMTVFANPLRGAQAHSSISLPLPAQEIVIGVVRRFAETVSAAVR